MAVSVSNLLMPVATLLLYLKDNAILLARCELSFVCNAVVEFEVQPFLPPSVDKSPVNFDAPLNCQSASVAVRTMPSDVEVLLVRRL